MGADLQKHSLQLTSNHISGRHNSERDGGEYWGTLTYVVTIHQLHTYYGID